jgi:hypothetical protein
MTPVIHRLLPDTGVTSGRVAAECELDSNVDMADVQPASEPLHPKRTNVWQETFSPQMNSNMKRLPKDYYDSPHSDGKTVWEHIVKADTIRHAAFDHFDENSAQPCHLPCAA